MCPSIEFAVEDQSGADAVSKRSTDNIVEPLRYALLAFPQRNQIHLILHKDRQMKHILKQIA